MAMRKAALLCLFLFAWPVGAAADPRSWWSCSPPRAAARARDSNTTSAGWRTAPGVLALTFSVDYWDYLGWTDTFAKPGIRRAPERYVTRLKLREPYTPQVIVDNREEAGLKSGEVDRLVLPGRHGQRDPRRTSASWARGAWTWVRRARRRAGPRSG
jgi:hypothetical protein